MIRLQRPLKDSKEMGGEMTRTEGGLIGEPGEAPSDLQV